MVSGLYDPRHTWLHAIPAGTKLALLSLAGTTVFLTSSPLLLLAVASLSAAIYLSLRSTTRTARRAVLLSAVFSSCIGLFHLWQGNPTVAAASALQLFSATALAVSFTVTTRYDAVLDAVNRGLLPLRALGLKTDRLSLALALMLRFADHFFVQWHKLDESYRLRTGRSPGIRLMAPLCLRMLEASVRISDALAVRIGDPSDECASPRRSTINRNER